MILMKLKAFMKSEYRGYIYLAIMMLVMCIISALSSRSALGEMLIIYFFFIGGILLPGLALARRFPIKGITNLEEMLFSLVIGYILSIFIYFLGMTLSLSAYFTYIYLIVFGISVIYLWKHRSLKRETGVDVRGEYIWIIAISILFVLTFIVFSMRHALPTYIDYNWWHNDFLHWLGNSVALKIEFPPKEFRTLADTYSYHYFGPLQLALTSMVTGLSIAEVGIVYSYILSISLLGLAVVCLLKRLIDNNDIILMTLFLLLISTGYEKLSVVVYYWNVYMVPMSFDVAIAFELVVILLILIQLRQDEFSLTNLILLLTSLLVCTGMKGPSGAIALCGIGIICIYWLFTKEYKKAFVYGILSLVVFGAIYFLLLSSANNVYSAGAETVIGMESTTTQVVKAGVLDWIISVGKELLHYCKYIICINPLTTIPTIPYTVFCVVKRKVNCTDIMLLFMLIVGTVLGYKLSYTGQSEMYFALSVMPFAAIMVGRALECLKNSFARLNGVKLVYRRLVVLFVIAMAFVTAYRGNYEGRLQLFVEYGITTLRGHEIECDSPNKAMTQKEYEAYEWISQNTDNKALFLSDRMLSAGEYCFIPGVFAERYIYRYSEEEMTDKNCYTGDVENIEYYMNKGVEYIIQNKLTSPGFVCPVEFGSIIFENEEVVVYQLETL